MNNYRLIIFDLDGTLTESKSGKPFRETADDWQWLPGRVERLIQLRVEGALLALATNQAGVAFPWSKFTEQEMRVELTRIMTDVGLAHVAVCFTSPNPKALPQYQAANDPRRKPGPGMLLEAMAACAATPEQTLYVGDRPEDAHAADAAGVAFTWAEDFFAVKDEAELPLSEMVTKHAQPRQRLEKLDLE